MRRPSRDSTRDPAPDDPSLAARRRVAAVRTPRAGWVPTPPGREPTGGPPDPPPDPPPEDTPPDDPSPDDPPPGRPVRRARHAGGVDVRSVLPSTLRGGRFALDPRAVVGVALIAVLAGLLAAGLLWRSRGGVAELAPPRTIGGRSATSSALLPAPGAIQPSSGPSPPGRPATPATPASGPPAGSAAAGPARLLVHVAGRVRKPGVVTLPAGARVVDALAAAGGATSGADLTAVNLARPLTDGEQVLVLAPGETPPAAPPGAGTAAGRAAPPGSGPVDLNAATLDQLDTLSGVGPVLAQRILDWRAEHGGFRSVEELREVTGIGDRRYADLAPRVRV